MEKNKAHFNFCPDCGDRINPILNICSCGYEIHQPQISHFESSTVTQQRFIQQMKELIDEENFPQWKKIYENPEKLSIPQQQHRFQQFFREINSNVKR